MIDLPTLLLSPHGRLGRQGFWVAAAGLFVTGLVAGLVPVIGGLVGLALLWPWSAVSAKRLHDLGRSGWWIALPLVPSLLVGGLGVLTAASATMGATMGASGATLALATLTATLGLAAMLVSLGFLLWIGLTPGMPGANRFGAVPAPLPLPGVA